MLNILFLLLAGFLGFMLVQHLFIFVYLYIETGLNKIYDSSYPTPSKQQLAKIFAQEFNYVLAKFYLYPLKFLNLNFSAQRSAKADSVVVLIHGFGRSQVDWLWFKRHLGHSKVYVVNLRPSAAPIEEISSNLELDLQQIIKANNNPTLSLIGHSMGGIVACYYAAELDTQRHVKQIITLGSPLHGTKLAVAASGANMIQIRPQSAFLATLRTAIVHSKLTIFNIATKTDNLVFPWTSPLLESTQTENTLILESESHLGLIHNSQVIQQIKQWLSI